MQNIDVFISYKREERALADQVSRALTKAGYVAVTDLNIQKATDFGEAIDRMIRAAKVVVVLWTKASAISDWVRKEANEAERLGKYYGVRLDAITPDDLPFQVRTIDWRDLSQTGLTGGMDALVGDVTKLIGTAKLSETRAEEQSKQAEKDLEFYQVVSEIGDIGGFRKYLDLYPTGAYVDDALAKIDGITADRDQEAFRDAREMAAVGGYRKYLTRFPQGAFVQDAQAFITQNTGWHGFLRRVPVLGIVGALGTATGALIAWANFFNVDVDTAHLTAQIKDLEAQIALQTATARQLAADRDSDKSRIAALTAELAQIERQSGPPLGLTVSRTSGSFKVSTSDIRSYGLKIDHVDANSHAARQGLRPGHVILDAGLRKVSWPGQIKEQMTATRNAGHASILLRVWTGRAIETFDVPMSAS